MLADKVFSRVIETASKIDEYVSSFVISGLHLFSFILLFCIFTDFYFYIFYFVYFSRSSFRLPSGGIL